MNNQQKILKQESSKKLLCPKAGYDYISKLFLKSYFLAIFTGTGYFETQSARDINLKRRIGQTFTCFFSSRMNIRRVQLHPN